MANTFEFVLELVRCDSDSVTKFILFPRSRNTEVTRIISYKAHWTNAYFWSGDFEILMFESQPTCEL